MSKVVPWSIKGVDFDAREAAKEAARRAGMTLGEWMNQAIVERADEIGVSAQDFDTEERLEAVAAQLARLSREREETPPAPQRRRGEATRQEYRSEPTQDDEQEFSRQEFSPPAPLRQAVAKKSFSRQEPEGAQTPRNRQTAERQAALAQEPARKEPRRVSRDAFDAEGLLEQAVAEFQEQAGRSEARTARAIAGVANLIETVETGRADALAQVDARLAEIEQKLQRGASESVKPLRGMISSVNDRLVDIEAQLTKKSQSPDYHPLRSALNRLETRIEAMSRRSEEPADDTALRQLDGKLADILTRIDKAEASPPGAARSEQLARLEARMDTLMDTLERKSARPGAPAVAPPVAAPPTSWRRLAASPARDGQRARLAGAIAEISARQRDLDAKPAGIGSGLDSRLDSGIGGAPGGGAGEAPTAAAPSPAFAAPAAASQPLAANSPQERRRDLDSRFEAKFEARFDARFDDLAERLERVAGRAAIPRDDKRIDRLQGGIEALSDRIEDMRREMAVKSAPSGALSGAMSGVEKSVRDLSARVGAALAAPSTAGIADLDWLRGDIAAMGRALADVAPRGAVAGLESAMRDLANRVEGARDAMLRAGEMREQGASSAEIEALSQQIAAMSRALENVAPRSHVTALESAMRDLANRIETSRDTGVREVVLAPIESLAEDVRRAVAEMAAGTHLERLDAQLRDVAAKVNNLREAGGADRATFLKACDQSDEIRAMLAAATARLAPLGRIEQQVASLAEGLELVSRQAAEAGAAHEAGWAQSAEGWRGIETRLDDLASRIERVADKQPEAPRIDDSRFDELSRRLDTMHHALAARIDGAQHETEPRHSPAAEPSLEPLLRALAEKLDTAMRPQAETGALEALERQVAQVSQRLERDADPQSADKLQRAIENLASRFEQTHEAAREAALDVAETAARQAARQVLQEALAKLPPARNEEMAQNIADLRDQRDQSDRRTHETLSAVHETLEKVVDRLAMLEDDVSETRAAQSERDIADLRQHSPLPLRRELAAASDDFDAATFLMEPGAGRPQERRNSARATASAKPGLAKRDVPNQDLPKQDLPKQDMASRDFDAFDDELADDFDEGEIEAPKPALQNNYIDAARRALAARSAAEAAEKEKADRNKKPVAAAAEVAGGERSAFVRPMASGERSGSRSAAGGRRRLPAVLSMAGLVLALGAYQAYRFFDEAPNGALQSAAEPQAEKTRAAAVAPPAQVKNTDVNTPDAGSVDAANAGAKDSGAKDSGAKDAKAAAPAAASSGAAPGPSAPATGGASGLPNLPSMIGPPTGAGKGVSMVDPLAVGSIGGRGKDPVAINPAAANIKDLAEKGDAAAQYELGARYAEGRLVARDAAAAIGWFEKAAAHGQAQAQYRLGAIYEKGVGAPRDAAKARDYYAKAAEQGNVRAMHNLAVLEAEGIDGKPDYASAAQWFRRAADYGVRDSQFNLAILYARGMGVSQSLPLSYVWFAIAAQQGDVDSAKKRDEIAGRLDAETLEKARKQASDFRARPPQSQVNEPPVVTPGPSASVAEPRRVATKI